MTEPQDPRVPDMVFDRRVPNAQGSYDWEAIADVLKQNPGKWTLAFRQERYSLHIAIRQGKIVALRPELGFRTVTRKNSRTKPRMADIYLAYMPEHDTTRPEW